MKIYVYRLQLDRQPLDELDPKKLTLFEKREWMQISNGLRRDQFLASRIALKEVLRSFHQAPLKKGVRRAPSGRPFIEKGSISISHSQSTLIFAYSPHVEIGIDVELAEKVPRYLKIASRYFTSAELKYIQKPLNENVRYKRFLLLWCTKEAGVKLEGGTLGQSLKQQTVLGPDKGKCRYFWNAKIRTALATKADIDWSEIHTYELSFKNAEFFRTELKSKFRSFGHY